MAKGFDPRKNLDADDIAWARREAERVVSGKYGETPGGEDTALKRAYINAQRKRFEDMKREASALRQKAEALKGRSPKENRRIQIPEGKCRGDGHIGDDSA